MSHITNMDYLPLSVNVNKKRWHARDEFEDNNVEKVLFVYTCIAITPNEQICLLLLLFDSFNSQTCTHLVQSSDIPT